MALGLLARVADGMPLLFTEMTILTAIRTAAMSALVAQHAARPESSIFGFIGLGAQFEFQLLAFSRIFKIKTVVLFDLDEQAIIKARANIASYNLTIIIANNAAELVAMSDVVTLATATKLQAEIISFNDIPPGCHINAIGGDCPGKTELAINDFCNCKIIIEYHPQTIMEGEIQNAISELQIIEFHEILKGSSSARESADEITLFDSVGFALSDYSVLRLIYGLLAHDDIGISANFVPKISDPKNLFELLL
jgi:ornithine cyclodeaminase